MSEREFGHRLGDVALLRHGDDDLLGALDGGLRIAVGCKPCRRFHEAGEHRRFCDADIARAMAKIFLRSGFDAESARAEIDAVQIEFENLILGIFMFQVNGKDRFLDFAR